MQIAYKMDSETKRKILIGSLLALTGGVAVGLTAWLVGIDAAKALLLAIISTAVPTLTNTVKEYRAGE